MVCEDTLRIKHLPIELSDPEKEDLLRHFGAQNVKILSFNNKEKCVAFAQFESKEIAKSVLLRLHQIKILNSRLCVEYAEHDIIQDKPRLNKIETVKVDKNNFKKFVNKLNAFNSSVNFYQPPPSHLRYAYPQPNRATINNIAHALASVPKFYTQVLHLMNKMNLPPPFSDIPDPPQVSMRQQIPPPPIRAEPQDTKEKSSSESEMESDPENSGHMKEIIPMKRNLPQKKGVKRPKFIKPTSININTSKTKDKTDQFFEKTEIQKHKIELKVTTSVLKEKAEKIPESVEEDVSRDEETEERSEKEVISEEDLRNNRIPSKDLNILPVFKDYHPGAPTSRLYIKNIAKTVEVKDLEYIYKRYLGNIENSQSAFNIRLMQEGRMKGQAFVTLDSVQLAQEALDETNGFILKDRPLVVLFAKSAAQKK